MNILDEIRKDHDEFRQQLQEAADNAEADRDQSVETFRSLREHLTAHHESEEEILFRRLVEFQEAKDIVEEAWEEHESIDLYLERMNRSHKSERWPAKVKVLQEMVEHHLDEEEQDVFAAVRETLGDELDALGEKFEAAEHRRMATH